MDLSVLKEQILKGELKHCYVFYGNEYRLQDIYIDKICEVSGCSIKQVDSLKSCFNSLSVKSLIKRKNVFVIRDDADFKRQEKLWEPFLNGEFQKDNIVIFVYTNMDKRGKFLKQMEEVSVEFNRLSSEILIPRVIAMTKLHQRFAQELVELCGYNYGRIELEISKLNILCNCNNYSINTAFLTALKYNLIYEEIGDVIFDFTNAVIDRNVKEAYRLYSKLKMSTEPNLRLITVLYNTFRNTLIVQSTKDNERTEEILGLSKGQIYVTSQHCGHYSLVEIVRAINILRFVEKGIKTGEIEDAVSVEYVLAQILGRITI